MPKAPPGPPRGILTIADELAAQQLASDTVKTKRFPTLLGRKLARMSASPLAFLRGAAPLFYELLASHPELADGPAGEGWLVGDLHLENFGAYRPDSLDDDAAGKKRNAVFDLNDFDDALVGPWRLDVLRLTTSLLLGGRELGANGILALDLADALLEAWSHAVFDGEKLPEAPAPVAMLIEQVRGQTRTSLLKGRTENVGGKVRFVRGPRYADVAPEVAEHVEASFEAYVATILPDERPGPKCSLSIVDTAFRIAGTGSLGGLRLAVLIEGHGGPDGGWIFDLKEQGAPSAEALLGAPAHPLAPAERVVTGFRACIAHPPRALGTTTLGELSLFGRRLAPQEDKLDLRRVKKGDLPALARYLGALLGRAHVRGAAKRPDASWSTSDREHVRHQAVRLAGIHEAAYLSLCHGMRPLLVS